MSTFTISDIYCGVTYSIEDSTSIPITQSFEVTSGPMFYKTLNTDTAFNINRLMPVTNSEVGFYNIKGRASIESGGRSSTCDITFEIVLNCDIETLTPPGTISDVLYTFHAAAVVVTLPETLSSFPSLCIVTHDLEIKDPTIFAPFATTSFAPLVSYVLATRTLTISYTIDNIFSPLITSNLI